MKYIIFALSFLILTGCQTSSSLTPEQLTKLSNDDLCRALGSYNDDGKIVLAIYDELSKRTEKVNNERCHALEIQGKTKDSHFDINKPYEFPGHSFNSSPLNSLNKNNSIIMSRDQDGNLRVEEPHNTPSQRPEALNENNKAKILREEYELIKRTRKINGINKSLGKPEEPIQQIMKHPGISF